MFGEHLGLFYKSKYGRDFRGVRYPNIIGPGRPPAGSSPSSWVIEECAKGNPFTLPWNSETKLPSLYVKDAAWSLVALGDAPLENINTVNYVVDGLTPTPSAGELADAVRSKVPGAQIDFHPVPEIQNYIDSLVRPVDDSNARQEWGWKPQYDLEGMVDDFLQEVKLHPQRYS